MQELRAVDLNNLHPQIIDYVKTEIAPFRMDKLFKAFFFSVKQLNKTDLS